MPETLAPPKTIAHRRQDTKPPLVWLIMGTRAGDNNQLLALAHALGWPFEVKKIEYNNLRRIPFLRSGLTIVARNSRDLVRPPWPDLVLCVGYGSVPVARFVRRQSGGRAKLVHIGNPRDKLKDFDLQITTPQYTRKASNLLELPFPIGNPAKDVQASREERDWLRAFRRPRRLIAVGGPARHWRLDHAALIETVRSLSAKESGSLIVATSARTTKQTRTLIATELADSPGVMVDHFPRFGVLLAECDEVYVTADSVSMISEAIVSGKRFGMIPIERSARGRLSHLLWERVTGRNTLPDFRNFWGLLNAEGLIGTVENPVASNVSDTVGRAAGAVRNLLNENAIGKSRA